MQPTSTRSTPKKVEAKHATSKHTRIRFPDYGAEAMTIPNDASPCSSAAAQKSRLLHESPHHCEAAFSCLEIASSADAQFPGKPPSYIDISAALPDADWHSTTGRQISYFVYINLEKRTPLPKSVSRHSSATRGTVRVARFTLCHAWSRADHTS